MTPILLMTLLETAFLIAAAQKAGDGMLLRVVLVNMILITLFGSVLITVAGVTMNYGNIWYAAVFAAQALLLIRSGWKSAAYSAAATLASLGVVLGALWVMTSASGGETLRHVAVLALQFAAAGFAAFSIGQATLIIIWRRLKCRPLWMKYGTAMTAAQLVDSAIFFPIAFGTSPNTDLGAVLELVATGCVLKIVLGWLSVPLVLALTPNRRAPMA